MRECLSWIRATVGSPAGKDLLAKLKVPVCHGCLWSPASTGQVVIGSGRRQVDGFFWVFFVLSCEWATSTLFLGRCVPNFHRVPIIAFLIAYCQCIIAICKSCWHLQWLIMSHLQLIMSDSQVVGCDIIGLFIMSELSACDHVKIFNCWPCNQQLLWNHVGSCAFWHKRPFEKLARKKSSD